jgi:multicomponent Na+:H+ antiporter subunit B
MAGLLVWAVTGLPGFGKYPGPYGDLINSVAVLERHVTNIVTAVNFDYRALDTLGEEYILFAAAIGVMLLLREQRGEQHYRLPEHPHAPIKRSEAARWIGLGFIGAIIVFGIYIVIHAQLTPGGGFQGGAILGTASVLVYLTTEERIYRRVTPKWLVEVAECTGAGGYALIGVAALLAGGAFLQNVLPLGKTGELASSGTIWLINFSVGLEVSAAFSMLYLEFIEEVPERTTKSE